MCRHYGKTAFLFNRFPRFIAQKCVNDTVPVSASNSETLNWTKSVRRPFPAASHTLSVMSAHQPKETVSAMQTRTICRHNIGGKMLIMPPLCLKYRFVKSQRTEIWWQILYITLDK